MMNNPAVLDNEFEVPELVIQIIDPNVLASKRLSRFVFPVLNFCAELPPGTEPVGIFPYGATYWTRTAEIQTRQADGTPLSFFLKVSQNETGRRMMSGEIVSMAHIHDTVADLAPNPIAWGSYATIPDTHFFVCSFVDMTDDIPAIERLPVKVAELHQKGLSPNGKFGFPVPNYQGRLSQVTTWADTWEECFANNLKGMLEHEEKTHGSNEQLKILACAIFEKVIPRLLRPLETGGRQIQPRLVHGDLWDGNCSTAVRTGGPVIYDASALYAHNECKSIV